MRATVVEVGSEIEQLVFKICSRPEQQTTSASRPKDSLGNVPLKSPTKLSFGGKYITKVAMGDWQFPESRDGNVETLYV